MQKWAYSIVSYPIYETLLGGVVANIDAEYLVAKQRAWDEAPDGPTAIEELAKFGREGWELVNAFPVSGKGWGGETMQVVFILKRPIEEDSPFNTG